MTLKHTQNGANSRRIIFKMLSELSVTFVAIPLSRIFGLTGRTCEVIPEYRK
jgi:hypothetical protein